MKRMLGVLLALAAISVYTECDFFLWNQQNEIQSYGQMNNLGHISIYTHKTGEYVNGRLDNNGNMVIREKNGRNATGGIVDTGHIYIHHSDGTEFDGHAICPLRN